jgi:ribosomal protein L40E
MINRAFRGTETSSTRLGCRRCHSERLDPQRGLTAKEALYECRDCGALSTISELVSVPRNAPLRGRELWPPRT